ncbi:tetratricopeptide repeat protein [Empedobacter brevis]
MNHPFKKRVSVFLFIIIHVTTFAQEYSKKKIDSLIAIIRNDDLYTHYSDKEILRLTTEIYYQSKQIHYKLPQLESLVKSMEVYYNTSDIKSLAEIEVETNSLALEIKDYYFLCRALRFEAWMYTKIGKYNEANNRLERALFFAEKIIDTDKRYQVLMNINSSYASYYEAYDGDVNKMLDYSIKAFEYAKKISTNNSKKDIYLANTSTVIGSIYLYKNDIKQSKKYILFAKNTYAKRIDKSGLIYIYKTLGGIANTEKEFERAEKYLIKAIQLSKKYNMPDAEKNIYPMLAEANKQLGNYKVSYENLEHYKRLNDSLRVIEKKTVNKTSNYIYSKKEQPLNISFLLYTGLIFSIFIAVILYYIIL